jgi:hypothetical protein
MTTFTTDDREEEYKKIVAAAPNQPGYEDAVDPVAYINKEDGLVCAKCYKPFTKELTDDEIADLIKAANDEIGFRHVRIFDFVKVLLRKAQEK